MKLVRAERAGRRAALLASLLLGGCTLKSPEVPTLDFAIRIPVADDRTTIQKVARDRPEFLHVGGDDRLALKFSNEFGDQGRQEIGDRLRIQTQQASFDAPVPVRVEVPSVPPLIIPVNLAVPASPDRAVPVAGVSRAGTVAASLGDIEPLTVRRSRLDLAVHNGLPVALTRLEVELFGQTLVFAALDPGQTQTRSIEIENELLGGEIPLQYRVVTAGGTVRVPADPSFTLTLSLKNLVVVIPPQPFAARKQIIPLPTDPISVNQARLRGGELFFDITNNTDFPLRSLRIVLEELRRGDEPVSFSLAGTLPPRGTQRAGSGDLEGAVFAPGAPERFLLSFEGRTDSFEVRVPFESLENRVSVRAIAQEMVFSRVEGVLNRLEVPIEPQETEVDFPEGLDKISLDSTAVKVFVTSGVGFQSEIDIAVEGTNNKGETGTLQIRKRFERGDPDNPVSLVIRPDPAELTDFLNLLPSRVVATPRVLVGDGVGVEAIASNHFVQVDSLVFQAPARFRITGDTQVQPDPVRRELKDDEARRRIDSNLLNARVITRIENHTPLGVRVSVLVAREAENVYTHPILRVPREGAFEVEAAPADAGGRASTSTISTQEIELSKEEVLKFLQKGGVFTGVLVEFGATGGEVELLGTDFINVQAAAEIFVQLDDNLVD